MMLRYHFIGICGASMSALAVYLKEKGNYVQGSDISNLEMQKKLTEHNIKVFNCHKKENLNDCDVVVYNYAIDQDNEELKTAKKRKLKVISRAELLGQISSTYKNVISISGSHGKTTTTAMLYSCLSCANLNPTLHIGGQLTGDDFGIRIGDEDYFITEACEYKDSFLKLKSKIGIILNTEPEHLDYFKNFDNELKSFNQFANNSENVICYDNNLITKQDIITYGKDNSNIVAKNIVLVNHRYHYDVYINNKLYSNIILGAVGKYNVVNSLAVIGACEFLEVDKEFVKKGLENFLGVKRRFEVISNNNNFVVHDYAHHPTEIKKTITAFKENALDKKILVVFQPHTFSRTKTLFNQFLTCFDYCDEIMLVKTYSAREKFDKDGSSYNLYKRLKSKQKCTYFANFDVGIKKILNKLQKNYAVLILGAGDVYQLAYELKKLL